MSKVRDRLLGRRCGDGFTPMFYYLVNLRKSAMNKAGLLKGSDGALVRCVGIGDADREAQPPENLIPDELSDDLGAKATADQEIDAACIGSCLAVHGVGLHYPDWLRVQQDGVDPHDGLATQARQVLRLDLGRCTGFR